MDDDDFEDGAYCNKEKAHPRAVSLMVEDFFWNPSLDDTPFGSDEAADGYYCWRDWRASNPKAPMIDTMTWILGDDPQAFLKIPLDDKVLEVFEGSSFSMDWDLWTLNITVITTALSQLLDEGTIDDKVKPFVHTATAIERSPHIENPGFMPAETLDAIDRVVAAA